MIIHAFLVGTSVGLNVFFGLLELARYVENKQIRRALNERPGR